MLLARYARGAMESLPAEWAMRLKRISRRFANPKRSPRDLSRGERRSVTRGRGLDFEAVREYALGDELRSLDWKVTARTGRPHIKVYREERNRPLSFAFELSSIFQSGTSR